MLRIEDLVLWNPRAYRLWSRREGVESLRVEMVSFPRKIETVVGTKDDFVLDSDGSANTYIGAESLSCELSGSKRNIAGIEESVKAVLSNWMAFNPKIGQGFVEVDLCQEAVGCAEAVVDVAAEGVDAFEVGTAKGRLKVKRD